MSVSVKRKLEAVAMYETRSAQAIAREFGVTKATVWRWVQRVKDGGVLFEHGGAREGAGYQVRPIGEAEIARLVALRREGWSMQKIAERLDRPRNTTYKIQRLARERGLLDDIKPKSKGWD